MRTATLILLTGVTMMLLGCGLSDGGQEAQEVETAPVELETPAGTVAPPPVVLETPAGTLVSPVVSETPKGTVAPPVETKTPKGTVAPPVETKTPTGTVAPPVELETPTGETPPEESETSSGTAAPLNVAPVAYDGPASLEERIFASPVIARVRFDSVSSVAESGNTYQGEKYLALLEFSFSVQEYLKGSGADDIVAVWAAPYFDTRQEAEDALPAIAAARDAQWDDREAIVFLRHSATYLPSTQQAASFFLSGEILFGEIPDDYYSLASPHNRLWLPAAAAAGETSQPTGDQQRFLTDVPPAEGAAPTITLGEIKTRIAAVTAKLDAGDDSEEYTECVRETYYLERKHQYLREIYPDRVNTGSNISPPHTHQFSSGLAGGTVGYEIPEGDPITPSVPFEVWLDGGDASLFSVATPSQDYRVTTTRPLPGRAYNFHFNHRGPYFSRCDGDTIRYEWTVTVNAPAGTLHEVFFDPVTDGTAVAADDSNGVLKPMSFTVGNTSTELTSLEWSSNQVVLTLGTHVSLSGYVLDFIALDGNVSLSLLTADATLDSTAGTYSWPMTTEPWENGDKLMLRIREGG